VDPGDLLSAQRLLRSAGPAPGVLAFLLSAQRLVDNIVGQRPEHVLGAREVAPLQRRREGGVRLDDRCPVADAIDDSVYAPQALRRRAWDRLARDLDGGVLEVMTEIIDLPDVVQAPPRILEGKVRGRIVVRIRD
jgi:hypothetical protein